MRIKTYAILTLTLSALAFSGCNSSRSQMGPEETNVLGIVKYEGQNYTPTGPNTIAVSSDEVVARRNFSGDKVTLLWGLITLKDY